MEPDCKPDYDALRVHINQQIKSLLKIEDTSGLELLITLQRVAHLSEALDSQHAGEMGLSGPRMRILIRLLIEEQFGNQEGINPTSLSHFQRVSKNTISALLRGLEEQGLIRRNLDRQDLRAFRIQITDAGREMVMKTAPRRIESLNRLLSALTPEERAQLTALLDKLQQTLLVHLHNFEISEENRVALREKLAERGK